MIWTRDLEKKLTSRVQIILTDPDMTSIFQKFGGEIFRRSSVFHGLRAFLDQNKVTGKRCFEIGTWNGLTAVVLSRFFDEVVTVDIVDNPIKHRVFDHLGITNVRCEVVENNIAKAKLAASLDFDCAYLDGDHAVDTRDDFEMCRKANRILFQEVWEFQEPVWTLVRSLLPNDEVKYGGDGLALWDGRHREATLDG